MKRPCSDAASSKEEAENALQLSYNPEKTRHRGEELRQINSFLSASPGGTLYVCGGPGTGKTLHVERATKVGGDDEQEDARRVVWLRGTSFGSGEAFVAELGRNMSLSVDFRGLSSREAAAAFEEAMLGGRRRQKTYRIVIDEIDSLVAVAGEAAKRIFRVASDARAKLVLVAIANSIDLPMRCLGARPDQTIVFEPYTFLQLRDILEDRVGGELFDSKALEFAARKVAAQTGDARKALDLCAKALGATARNDHARVRLEDVKNATQADARHSNAATAIATLPLHARLALRAALTLGKSQFTKHDLARAYRDNCPGLVQDNSTEEAFDLLQSTGLLREISSPVNTATGLTKKRAQQQPPLSKSSGGRSGSGGGSKPGKKMVRRRALATASLCLGIDSLAIERALAQLEQTNAQTAGISSLL